MTTQEDDKSSKEHRVNKQEIVVELNRAKFRGFDNWVDTIIGIVGGDDGEKILLSPDKAAQEVAAISHNREAWKAWQA